MERNQLGTILMVIGAPFVIWAIVKASIIGYYPDELVPQIVVPGAIGLPMLWIGNWMRKSASEPEG